MLVVIKHGSNSYIESFNDDISFKINKSDRSKPFFQAFSDNDQKDEPKEIYSFSIINQEHFIQVDIFTLSGVKVSSEYLDGKR